MNRSSFNARHAVCDSIQEKHLESILMIILTSV